MSDRKWTTLGPTYTNIRPTAALTHDVVRLPLPTAMSHAGVLGQRPPPSSPQTLFHPVCVHIMHTRSGFPVQLRRDIMYVCDLFRGFLDTTRMRNILTR